ncbi:hypothetical protein M0813_05376 [Anaeramoeba flamelloides]|uniref:Uncharacterized protein n=1 Tax=Anaeramoeba flamelloides TaxID=1746091 RepID=A0ABQ8XHD0_9EUKA|nr:hypothetical protein M0813_05376 [Anaeramoeba flamelloides]
MSLFKKTLNNFKSLTEINNVIDSEIGITKYYQNITKQQKSMQTALGKWSEGESEFKEISNLLNRLIDLNAQRIKSSDTIQKARTDFTKSLQVILARYKQYLSVQKVTKQKQSKFQSAEKALSNAKKNLEKAKKKSNFEMKRPILQSSVEKRETDFKKSRREAKVAEENRKQTFKEFQDFKLKTIKDAYTNLYQARLGVIEEEVERLEEQLNELNELPSEIKFSESESESGSGSGSGSGSNESEKNDSEKNSEQEKEQEKEKKEKKKKEESDEEEVEEDVSSEEEKKEEEKKEEEKKEEESEETSSSDENSEED